MLTISETIKNPAIEKTEEMEQYEKETGKYAIWREKITDGFQKWKKGEKIYDKDKERISFYVSEETKGKWKEFASSYKYPTISKLIREAVNNFIERKASLLNENLENLDIDAISSLSHSLKEPLTSIKGYLQLLIEEYGDKLEDNVLHIIENVLDQSNLLETKIIDKLDNNKEQGVPYDILIIEDSVTTVKLLEDYFESKGYTCVSTYTGAKGLEALYSGKPRLVLLDIILPDLSGYEICKSIKNNDKFKDIPIFYITAVPGSKVEDKMEETKADGIILKPFNLTDLNHLFEYLEQPDTQA